MWHRTGRVQWTRYGWHHVLWVEWAHDDGEVLWCINLVHPEREVLS